MLEHGQPAHHGGSVFHRVRTQQHRDAAWWNRPRRRAPEGFFAALHDEAEEQRVACRRLFGGGRSADQGPPVDVAAASVDVDGEGRTHPGATGRWADTDQRGRGSGKRDRVAPGRLLSELRIPCVPMWNLTLVHARVRAAARDWPAGHKPLGFPCRIARHQDGDVVRSRALHQAVLAGRLRSMTKMSIDERLASGNPAFNIPSSCPGVLGRGRSSGCLGRFLPGTFPNHSTI